MARYAFISDIHGNLEALRSVLEDITVQSVDEIVCLGDIVGYGPDPAECVRLVREACENTILGNHEVFATMPSGLEKFHPAIRDGLELARRELSEEELSWLGKLPFVLHQGEATMVHASLDEPLLFHHLRDEAGALRHFRFQETPLCFFGHTHIAQAFEEAEERIEIRETFEELVPVAEDERLAVNVGSVGQPRDGDPRACYLLYDEDGNLVQHRRIYYDIAAVQKRIQERGLEHSLAVRLAEGK